MRLRDILPHANFVASATVLNDAALRRAAEIAIECQVNIQRGGVNYTPDEFYNDMSMDNFRDWREHILMLMLLRDCLGREMTRRGLTPPGPPMLARDWESGGMYPLGSGVIVEMPEWLLERGRRELAAGPVARYNGAEGEQHG